ncbi:MAG: hypothetical protein FJX61_01010 [Alphaproteobacteria bacterium]|nr:hypothetical protein [Alphaproteobacteria bacterium]
MEIAAGFDDRDLEAGEAAEFDAERLGAPAVAGIAVNADADRSDPLLDRPRIGVVFGPERDDAVFANERFGAGVGVFLPADRRGGERDENRRECGCDERTHA